MKNHHFTKTTRVNDSNKNQWIPIGERLLGNRTRIHLKISYQRMLITKGKGTFTMKPSGEHSLNQMIKCAITNTAK